MRKNLKILRITNDLSQEEMAKKIGCTRQCYAAVEGGKRAGSQRFWLKLQMAFAIPDEEVWSYIKNDEG